ncbi:D-isomer specific 2-hydroxyacid dehydrogenase family protein [Corynebacterium breve]|uniref:D-isomer specific 2-hydroxyacid dehydrogenase family protein n=1 Tax=Corynebacterium breve TaxID=3049799 RepID=A0ABY8VG11_9CORY|nr:D-isomer specific 2-hydroxyacid dehydrogenase family protein [Corynebacterium breve]WIM67159.1 D-isomer specific 2-hydroxyacid dehydrogenase family protein [Corynebacterium breve]
MKFTFLGSPWPEVVAEVEAAGHTYVSELDHAECLIYRGEPLPQLPPSIQWIQFVYSGIDRILPLIRSTDVRWANASGVYATPVAEAALALTLSVMHQHKPATLYGTFRARGILDQHTQLLADDQRTVAILGAGGIGKRLIGMLEGFDVSTVAVNRSGRPVEGATEVVTFDQIEAVWPRADVLVNLLPLTAETEGLVDKQVFEALPDHAVVVNVGRGPVVVTDDLVYALESGQIAGAGLDVTDPEPLPEDHKLWQLPNCTITPHTATTGSTGRKFIAPCIIENARAFEAGETMPTEIDKRKGY